MISPSSLSTLSSLSLPSAASPRAPVRTPGSVREASAVPRASSTLAIGGASPPVPGGQTTSTGSPTRAGRGSVLDLSV